MALITIQECEVKKKPVKRSFRKLDLEKLKEYLVKHPDAYLREIAAEFGCCETTLTYACRRLGITRKKTRIIEEQSAKQVAEYEERIKDIPKDKRV